jgi:glycosyltransferase involved in cell wall biosynthesis
MRILHIVPTYLPAYGYGGPILSVHTLNKWLVKAGEDVTVYTTNMDGRKRLDIPTCREVDLDGVKVHYFPITFAPWQHSSAMREALKRNAGSFDLIHITSVFLSASALGAHYAKKFGVPYVISPRGSLMKEPLARKSAFLKKIYIALIEKKNLEGAAAIHFTAEVEKKEYIDAGLPLKGSFIVPNGLDAETLDKEVPAGIFRRKFGIEPSRKIVLSLGRLNWKKGFDTLIPAFKRVLDVEPEALLAIAGGDEERYRRVIEKLISGNNLEVGKDVIFTGELLDEMKIAAFEESGLFALPSYSENFGMAAIEAAMETAVVVTPEVGISPSVKKYGAGLVVEKDERKFAEAILEILENPSEKERLKKGGREMVKNEFSSEKVAEAMLTAYNGVIKNYGKSTRFGGRPDPQ